MIKFVGSCGRGERREMHVSVSPRVPLNHLSPHCLFPLFTLFSNVLLFLLCPTSPVSCLFFPIPLLPSSSSYSFKPLPPLHMLFLSLHNRFPFILFPSSYFYCPCNPIFLPFFPYSFFPFSSRYFLFSSICSLSLYPISSFLLFPLSYVPFPLFIHPFLTHPFFPLSL